MTFHRDCRAVLKSARDETDGVEELRSRRPLDVLRSSRFGFGDTGVNASWVRKIEEEKYCNEENENPCDTSIEECLAPPPPLSTSLSPSMSVRTNVGLALETALSLLEKDRLCAQLLGMQSLVLLTDVNSSRLEKAYLSSLCVLRSPMTHTASIDRNYSASSLNDYDDHKEEDREGGDSTASAITRIHSRILRIILYLGYDHNDDSLDRHTHPKQPLHNDTTTTSSITTHSSYLSKKSTTTHQQPLTNQINPEFHISMRRMAIQSLTNALSTILPNSHRFPQYPPLRCPMLHSTTRNTTNRGISGGGGVGGEDNNNNEQLLESVALDLEGAVRRPMAVLTCAHEQH